MVEETKKMTKINSPPVVSIPLRHYMWALGISWSVAVGIALAWELWDEIDRGWEVAAGAARTLLMQDAVLRQGKLDSNIEIVRLLSTNDRCDAWEKNALAAIARGETEVSSFDKIGGKMYLRMMRPAPVEKTASPDAGENRPQMRELARGITTSVPMSAIWPSTSSQIVRRLFGYGGMWFLGLGGIIYASHQLQFQVRRRQKTEEQLRETQINLERQVIERSRAESAVRALAGKLFTAQEEERSRVAREIHDDMTQRIAALAIEVGKLEQVYKTPEPLACKLSEIKNRLIKLSQDVQLLSRQLHPSILDDLGLVEALRSECAGFSQREGIAIHFLPRDIPPAIPKEVGLCLYRIAQEGLRNITRHSGAEKAQVSLTAVEDSILLSIEDTGVGFDPEQVRKKRPGLGLVSMEERARLIGGEFAFDSQPGRGTLIEVWAPLMEKKP